MPHRQPRERIARAIVEQFPPRAHPDNDDFTEALRYADAALEAIRNVWTEREREFAHALYTVAMHANTHGDASALILDRIQGAAEKYPELFEAYPQLREVL